MTVSIDRILGKALLNDEIMKKLVQELFHGVNPKKINGQCSISNYQLAMKTKPLRRKIIAFCIDYWPLIIEH